MELFLGIIFLFLVPPFAPFVGGEANYWLATGHPLTRLPIFFMGICAGVICIRIQTGDLDALTRKIFNGQTITARPF